MLRAEPDATRAKGEAEAEARAEKVETIAGGHELLRVDLGGCTVLNANDADALASVLREGGELTSDCDEQLMIELRFPGPVKIHSIALAGPAASAPAEIQLFVNRGAMSFDDAETGAPPTQCVTLKPADVVGDGRPVALQYVKFQSASSLTIFVPKNFGGGETTSLHRLRFYGTPLHTTNMKDLKKMG